MVMMTLASAASVASISFVFSAPALATGGGDAEFLSDLDRNNIWYTSATFVISQAHNICRLMDRGTKRFQIADFLINDGFQGDWDTADTFVIAANDAYCPWLEPLEPNQYN